MSSVQELVEHFCEGWQLQQVKHTIKDNTGLSIEKIKRAFGLNHNFTRQEIKKRNEDRLKSLLDSADSKSDLEGLAAQLERWIKAAPRSVRDINSVEDSDKIKNHNQGVVADVTALNKMYLAKVKSKLASAKQ